MHSPESNIGYRLGVLTMRPLNPEDMHEILDVLRVLAGQSDTDPTALGWWTRALGGTDGSKCSLADVAREAHVSYSNAYNGRLTPDEAERISAVLTRERDAYIGRLVAFAEREAEPLRLAAKYAQTESAIRHLANIARCAEPIAVTVPRRSDDYASPQRNAITRYPAITCPACAHQWEPRVPRPKKCPNGKCQYPLSYPDLPRHV